MRLMWQDAVIVVGFLLYLGCGAATNMIMAQVAQEAGFALAVEELEANPIARKFMDFSYGLLMVQLIAISFFGGVYWLLRCTVTRAQDSTLREYNHMILAFYSIAMFLLFVQNFANDLSVLIGLNM